MSIYVGFAEKPEEDFDTFPDKIGGKPVWIVPKSIPSDPELKCGRCEKTMSLLVQIYAPLVAVSPSAFHRSLYVFCCQDGDCLKQSPEQSYVVLRGQLPKENSYYRSEDDETIPIVTEHRLCRLTGLFSNMSCSSCKCVYYATSAMQKEDWGKRHKKECPALKNLKDKEQPIERLLQLANLPSASVNASHLFEEFEIIPEKSQNSHNQFDPVGLGCEVSSSDDEESTEELKEKNQKLIDELAGNTKKFLSEKFTEEDFKTSPVLIDEYYNYCMTMIKGETDQVFRYYENRGVEPLWYSSKGRAVKENIPKCQYCGSERVCEFQLLYFLKVDTRFERPIDFATLVIYTCQKSCDRTDGQAYAREYLYQQSQEVKEKESDIPNSNSALVKK